MITKREAFSVVTIEEIESQKLLIRGRAYVDIKIGDTLLLIPSGTEVVYSEVVGISSYRKNLTEINAGLTGELILLGVFSFPLNNIDMLYKKSTSYE